MEQKPPATPPEEPEELDAAESLEDTSAPDTEAPADDANETLDAQQASSSSQPAALPARPGGFKGLFRHFNIYLLLYIIVLLIAATVILISYAQSRKASAPTTATLKTQDLTQAALDQLAASDATLGDSKHVLTVQSSAIFAGKVLFRDGLEVAGNLRLGGTAALNDLSVSGTAQLGQTQVNKNLAVAGDTAIQGTATIAKSLQVNGNGSFGGSLTAAQITTSSLQLNGDLVLTRHITIGGSTPGRSNGTALGSGGSMGVSGSDTAGSISINTGGSPPAGCFATIEFAQKYSTTPRVLVTPIGSAAGSLSYYVNRTATGFSICTAGPPPASTSFGFDYWVVN
jgi:cell division protein FtsL